MKKLTLSLILMVLPVAAALVQPLRTDLGMVTGSIAAFKGIPFAAPPVGTSTRFNVTVDGWFLPMDVEETIAAGKQNDVPMITGMVAAEGSSAATYGKIPAGEWQTQMRDRYGDLAAEFLKLYPSGSAEESRTSQILSAREQAQSTFAQPRAASIPWLELV